MSRFKCGVAVAFLLFGASTVIAADGDGGWSYDRGLRYVSDDGRFNIAFNEMFQARGIWSDPDLGDSGSSFDISRFKLLASGQVYEDWQFGMQIDFARGSEVSEDLLEDAWISYTRWRYAQMWVGQGKVPFSRQFIVWSGDQMFVDRSIASDRFAHGRDVGFAFIGEANNDSYSYSVGVYNGNGINRDKDENEDYLVASRILITPLGKFKLVESDPEWTDPRTKIAAGVSVMTNNVGTGTVEEERINTAGIELAIRKHGFNFVSEFYTQNEDELLGAPGDETETDGWYAQMSYIWAVGELLRLELAGRYSEILRDMVDSDTSEAGVAVNLYFRGHDRKLQIDYRELDFEGVEITGNTDLSEFRIQLQLVF